MTTLLIHFFFNLTGIVGDPHQSLFTYGPNGDWDTYHRPEYNPTFEPNFSDPHLEEQAQEICSGDKLCLFDIAATGNIDIGSSTMNSVLQQEILRTQFVSSKHTLSSGLATLVIMYKVVYNLGQT